MANCIFTGLPAEVTPHRKKNCSIVEVDYKNESYVYWLQNSLKDDLKLQYQKKALSLITVTKIMNKILSLNEEKLIPYIMYDENYNFDTEDENILPIEYSKLIKTGIDHQEKEKNILKLLGRRTKDLSPFSAIGFHHFDLYRLLIGDIDELLTWINNLQKNGLVKTYSSMVGAPLFSQENFISITPKGWENLHELNSSFLNNNVFIAMAFTDNEGNIFDPKVREIIKEACTELKWSPQIVDENEHNEGIVDKIIALIQNSKFVIADLTHHKHGVYYEAGYAKALGIPVIHTVHEGHFDKVHFDLKHINLIKWKDHDDLKNKLINRIALTILKNKKETLCLI